MSDAADGRRGRAVRPRPGGGLRPHRPADRDGRASAGVRLLALPEACLGGYLTSLDGTAARRPPPLALDGPEIRRLAALAGDMVVTRGLLRDGRGRPVQQRGLRSGDGVLGNHRKVHQPLAEDACYRRGDRFARLRHPGRPARHDDLLRQGVSRSRPGRWRWTGPRSSSAFRPGRAAAPTRRGPGPGPVDAPLRPVRPGPGAGEPDRLAVGEPVGHVRRAALRRQRQGGGSRRRGAGQHGRRRGHGDRRTGRAGGAGTARRSMGHLRNRRPEAYLPVEVG